MEEALFNPTNSSDSISDNSNDYSITEDVASVKAGSVNNTACCSPITNGKRRSTPGIKKTFEEHSKNYNNRIMVQPVILPCEHGYCFECLSQFTEMKCQVCARPFTIRDAKVSRYLSQICDWFGDNRTFISLLLGQDLSQPPPPARMRLARSTSTDIVSRASTPFEANPPTRCNSTDSIGSILEETDFEELTAGLYQAGGRGVGGVKGVGGSERDPGDSTRLAKLGIGLRMKPSDANGTDGVLPSPQKSHRFSIMSGKASNGNPPRSSLSPTPPANHSSFLKKIRGSRKETSLPYDTPRPIAKTEDPLGKYKSDSRLMDKISIRKELAANNKSIPPTEPALPSSFGLMGTHKRNLSSVQVGEKIAPHKNKSKSFTTTNSTPNFPAPPSPRSKSISTTTTTVATSTTSTSTSASASASTSTSTSTATTTIAAAVATVAGAAGATSANGNRTSGMLRTSSTTTITRGFTDPSAFPNPSSPTTSALAKFNSASPTPVSSSPTTTPTSPTTPPFLVSKMLSSANLLSSSSSKIMPRSKLGASINLTNPEVERSEGVTRSNSSYGSIASTVPSSAFFRPVKFGVPNANPANLSQIFSDPLSSRLEFKKESKTRGPKSPEPINKRFASFFMAPQAASPSTLIDSVEALESMAMYLPTEALEFGVVLAAKDPKCNLRKNSVKKPSLPRRRFAEKLTASGGIKTLGTASKKPIHTKRLSLPNIPLSEPTWKKTAPNETNEKKASSLELFRETPRSGSSSISLQPPLSPLSSPHPPRSGGPSKPHHNKISSLLMSKLKSFSTSSDDLRRDFSTKLQSRQQSSSDVNKMMKFLGMEMGVELQWTTKNLENYRHYLWSSGREPEGCAELGPPIELKPGWNVEYRESIPLGKVIFEVEDRQKDVCWYTDHFFCKNHTTYLAGDNQNPLFIAVETEGSPPYKVLVRSILDDDRLWVLDYSKKHVVKALKLESENMKQLKDFSMLQEMAQWDCKEVCRNFKFGVMFCKSGQTSEAEMFANTSGCLAYEKLLECIGDKVVLKGWSKFAGGLDVDRNFDGTHSVFTKFKQYEVMFHVATLLSHMKNDSQQLEKKKHVGNDIVVMLFMDAGSPPLDPTFMRTQFTQVYILVQPVYSTPANTYDSNTKFRVSIAAKDGVRPFGPNIPENLDFELGPLLRHFLLLKLINAERAALSSPVFRERLVGARRLFLSSLLSSSSSSSR